MVNPTPYDNPELFESIVLAGVRSPGSVKLSGHDREVDWDIKTGSGTSGATTTLKAEKLVEFTATFYLVQDIAQGVDDIELWPDFQDLIESSTNGKTPKALDIYHPDLAANRIKSVVKKSIGGVVHDGKGGQTIAVKFLEYRPPKPKGGSPSGSKSKPPSKPDPNAAAKAELEKLTKQYQQTPWG